MTESQAETLTNRLIDLFPQEQYEKEKPPPSPISAAELPLYWALFQNYPFELGEAAVKGYKAETIRKRPILGELRRKIMGMAENFAGKTVKTGAAATAEAERAKWAEWHQKADADDEVTRAWIASLSDADITRIAQRAINENSAMLMGIFGHEDASTRLTQARVKGIAKIDAGRIRRNFFARGMLRAFADLQAEAVGA